MKALKEFFRIFSILSLLLSVSVTNVHACTTFLLKKDGKLVFGRNYDWMTGTGMIHTNLRGLQKSALSIEEGNMLGWTSIYGSMTFNQYGKEFPNGGMNEKGLVVELMWLDESEYAVKDQRPSISVLQWIQYQLDNAATVDEVIASDKKIRIFSTGTPQHYLVADASGAAATIEFLDGKMVVHRNESLPYAVLANTNYATSIASLKTNKTTDNSLQRFSKACKMMKELETKNVSVPLVDYAFSMLEEVAIGDYTKWSIVYDINNRSVYFKTSGSRKLRNFNLNAFAYECGNKAKMYNLSLKETGAINTFFQNFSDQENSKLLKQAFVESSSEVKVPVYLQSLMAELPKKIICRK